MSVKTRQILFNGKIKTVVVPATKYRKGLTTSLAPCTGRLLLNCTNGVGCKGHKVKWIKLRDLWEPREAIDAAIAAGEGK